MEDLGDADRYLTIFPKGLHTAAMRMLQGSAKSRVVDEDTSIDVAQLRSFLEHRDASERHKRRKKSVDQTCQRIVGSCFFNNQNVSIGYHNWEDIVAHPGEHPGSVWVAFVTKEIPKQVAEKRFLGPLLGLVGDFAVDLSPSHALDQAVVQVKSALVGPNYRDSFERALQLWKQHTETVWKKQVSLRDLKYRLSCVRSDSNKYEYKRQEFVAAVVDEVVPEEYGRTWKVSMEQWDLEIVLLVRPTSLVVGLSVRDYRGAGTASFAQRTFPTDISKPYIQPKNVEIVRLRPATASLLLSLAQIRPGDFVLDPCAGIGTIPIESDLSGYNCVGIGGDLIMGHTASRSLTVEYLNQARRLPSARGANMVEWDAACLPIRSQCVDVGISDLPFGIRCLSSGKLSALLPLLFWEMGRVLRQETGRMVLLCGAYVQVLEILAEQNVWKMPCDAVFPVNIGGHIAWTVIVKRNRVEWTPNPYHIGRLRKLVNRRNKHNRSKTSEEKVKLRPQAK